MRALAVVLGSSGLIVLSAMCVSACGPLLPGKQLGSYSVVATAQSNTCGNELGAPSSYPFYVALSESGTTLYWSWLDDQPIASGTLSDATVGGGQQQATLSSTETGNVDGTDAGYGPCTMARADGLVVTLGAGTPPTTFTGTMSYTFSASGASNCSDQLTSEGGSYAQLPCVLSYTIAGTLK